MNNIKIGYFADGPWSHKAFDKIITDPTIDIQFIVPRTDTKDSTLKKYSEKYRIDFLNPARINTVEFIEKAKTYNCDLFVSMSFDQIFKEEIINLPKHKTINCHAGKLPFYRGRNVLNWAIINDEKEFGITVHYIDEGIDTGDIILQRIFPISETDDYSTLLEVSYVECANILYDSIKKIQNNEVQSISQNAIHPVGFYCGRRVAGDEVINWNQSSRDIFNFIRSICNPGPQATTFMEGKEVKINSSRLIQDAITYKGKPGQILVKTRNGYLVKTMNSFIEILEFEYKGELKVGKVFQ